MQYKYTENEDFSFLSSGNVIKHFSGMPCFPVRLGLELFEIAYRRLGKTKLAVYDPCCGNAFSLTVLGMMKQDKISALYGSDIAPDCVSAATCNLSLITRQGLSEARNTFLSHATVSEERRAQFLSSTEKIMSYLTTPPEKALFCTIFCAPRRKFLSPSTSFWPIFRTGS